MVDLEIKLLLKIKFFFYHNSVISKDITFLMLGFQISDNMFVGDLLNDI